MAYSLRRPLIVTTTPIEDAIDLRIAKLVGVPWSFHAFERVALIHADEPIFEAAVSAAAMLCRYAPHDRIVLLGRETCEAFGLGHLSPLATTKWVRRAFLYLPNPWPDEPEASRALQAFLDGPPAELPRCGVG